MQSINTNHMSMLSFIRFRNSHAIGSVIVQCFMLVSALLVIFGLVYVCILAIAIAIHHVFFDRDPSAVPNYVKKSMQFDSDSESDSENNTNNNVGRKKSRPNEEIIEIDDDADEMERRANLNLSNTVRKAGQLDKFMGKDIDVKKK